MISCIGNLMKPIRLVLRTPTFTVAKGRISDGAESGEEIPFLRGYLHDTVDVTDTAAVESMIHNSWN